MPGSKYIKFPARRLVSADRRGCSMAVRTAELLECWGTCARVGQIVFGLQRSERLIQIPNAAAL